MAQTTSKTKLNCIKFLFQLNKVNLLTILMMINISCKKVPTINLNKNPENFSEIFIQFWERMNIQYVYWDRDTTDWNYIYTKYKPLFDKLNYNEVDKKIASIYFKEITSQLIDNHFNITFQDPAIANNYINPSMNRKIRKDGFHDRYNYDDIVKTYLDSNYLSGKGSINSNGVLINALSGTINENLLYFHCNFFSLKQSYDLKDNNKIKQILDYFFSQLKRKINPIKGIILDVRNNGGGDIVDLNFFAGRLIKQDIIFGYTRSKRGLGKFDYLPWLEARLKHNPDYSINAPIILIGDNFSASIAETMIIALKSNKNLFIGEQTYGATGPLSDSEIFNSGSFKIGNFMNVNTSSSEFKGSDDSFYENIGIEPDIFLPFNLKELSKGKDVQLELAISKVQ